MSGPVIHDSGAGPALLLLHAFPLDASQWDGQVAALSDRYRCLRPDFWGCGTSPPPPGTVSVDSYARDVLGALDGLGIDQFSVCGGSMGGYVAFALLRQARDRVRSLVLANTRATADSSDGRAARRAMAEEVRSGGVEAIVEPTTARMLCSRCRDEVHIADPVRGRIRRCTTAGVVAALTAMAERPDSSELLGGLDIPTLVVLGSADPVVPVEEARAVAAAIRGAALEEFSGSAHLTNLEQPARFSQVVGDFLDAQVTPR
ncbi:MAG TPA: alpha/beta fold hydrolase [Candidatus Dormibacteraeota bacterium]|nr:alpha/beta fold hydrolase [Candidatus Dormibacteraeota bacterium]